MPHARLGLPDHQFGEFAAVFDVLVQPEFKGRPDEVGDEPDSVARIQAFLDLALKLGIEYSGRQNERGAGENIFRQKTDAFGQQGMNFRETSDSIEETVAQADFHAFRLPEWESG